MKIYQTTFQAVEDPSIKAIQEGAAGSFEAAFESAATRLVLHNKDITSPYLIRAGYHWELISIQKISDDADAWIAEQKQKVLDWQKSQGIDRSKA